MSQLNLTGDEVELPCTKQSGASIPVLIAELEAEDTKEYRYFIKFEIMPGTFLNPAKSKISCSYRHKTNLENNKEIWLKIDDDLALRKIAEAILTLYYITNRKRYISFADIRESIKWVDKAAREEAIDKLMEL
jgi:hypothetical protein